MKSYIEITGKYLRVQKKRSVLTVLGIIMSVALVTGIGTLFTSMYDANVRTTIRDNGDYYAAITGVPGDKANAFTGSVDIEKSGFSKTIGFAAYAANEKNDTEAPNKYFVIDSLDSVAHTMLPYTLQEGAMPAKDGEIALDNWTLKYLPGVKLGSVISLDVGTRTLPDGTITTEIHNADPAEKFTKTETRQYKVVGLLKPAYVSDTNFAKAITYIDAGNLPKGESYSVYVKLKSVNSVQEHIKRLVAAAGLNVVKGGPTQINFNDRLLRLYAQSVNETLNDSVIRTFIVILLLVIISTIAVIYNAFNISVVERVSQFGLLRCVGATPRQIRKIVFREALILGVIGIPIGVVCGTIAMGVVFSIISAIAPNMVVLGGLKLVVSPYLLVVSVIIGAFTIYLSALFPARKAAKISPIEAVRGTGSIKKEKFRKTDRYRVVLKLLGAEGWMAWKNLGRNRKRFYITVFSMVISIVLYIAFSSLVGYAYQSDAVDTGDLPSYLVNSTRSEGKVDLSPAEFSKLRQMQGVDYVLRRSTAYGDVHMAENKLDPRAKELLMQNQLNKDDSGNVLLYNSNILCYGDESLDIVSQSLGIGALDNKAFFDGQGIILLNGAVFIDAKNQRQVFVNMTTFKVGDTINVSVTSGPEEKVSTVTKELKILAIVEEGLMGDVRNTSGGVLMIGSEKLVAEMAPTLPFPTSMMIMMKPKIDRTEVKAYLDNYIDPVYNVMDYDEAAKNQMQAMTVMSIFLYGFVAVISLIGCLNIINTISTNIIIRTRELSVMRAIGMGDGNVRKMVAMESILHGAAAALIGSVAGSLVSWLVYKSIIAVREFPWALPWPQILIAVGAAALVAVVSALIPLKRISSGVIMEGIRGEE